MKRNFILIPGLLLALTAIARQPNRGYRGFVDVSNDVHRTQWVESTTAYYSGLQTSHGYQFNPWLFAGAGIGVESCRKFDSYIIPVFVQGRVDLSLGKFTPFGDVRVGYNLSGGGGAYFSPHIGYRFNWGRKVGINVGAGLTLQGYTAAVYDVVISPEGYWTMNYIGDSNECNVYFSFRLGLDF